MKIRDTNKMNVQNCKKKNLSLKNSKMSELHCEYNYIFLYPTILFSFVIEKNQRPERSQRRRTDIFWNIYIMELFELSFIIYY